MKSIKYYKLSSIKPNREFYKRLKYISESTLPRNIPGYLTCSYYKNLEDFYHKTKVSGTYEGRWYICHKFFILRGEENIKTTKYYRISTIKPNKQFYERMRHIDYKSIFVPPCLSSGYYKNTEEYRKNARPFPIPKETKLYLCHKFFIER